VIHYIIQVEECHDRYIVIGDEYTELRETVVTTTLSENSEKLEQILKVLLIVKKRTDDTGISYS
jgi:16S rRNA C1402 (ribose-2'-O) methylase RsmI